MLRIDCAKKLQRIKSQIAIVAIAAAEVPLTVHPAIGDDG